MSASKKDKIKMINITRSWRMVRFLIVALMTGSFLLGCGGSKKDDEGDTAGTLAEDSVESTPMTFDPMGSDSGNIPGLNTVNFDYDRSTLTSQAKDLLAQNAEWIRNNPEASIQIEGHCDERGSIEYNLALGDRRAKAVKGYLVDLGVDSNRLSILSYGEEKLLDMGSTEDAHSRNRRANFVPLQ